MMNQYLPDSGSRVNGLEQPLDRKPKRALWMSVRKQITIRLIRHFSHFRELILHLQTVDLQACIR